MRSGCTWTEQAKLAPSGASAAYNYGAAVAVHGDTVLLAAPKVLTAGTLHGDGAIYVFVRADGKWTQQATLTDPTAPFTKTDEQLAGGIALEGDTAMVGLGLFDTATDTVDVFQRTNGAWTLGSKLPLSPIPATAESGGVRSVALRGDRAVVGRPFVSLSSMTAGVTRGGFSVRPASRTLERHAPRRRFRSRGKEGSGVRIRTHPGDVRAPGSAPGLDWQRNRCGLCLSRARRAWTEQAIMHDDGEDDVPGFGAGVALQSGVAVIGAPATLSPKSRGSAYVFALGDPGVCGVGGTGGVGGAGGAGTGGGAGTAGGAGAGAAGTGGGAGGGGSARRPAPALALLLVFLGLLGGSIGRRSSSGRTVRGGAPPLRRHAPPH